MIMGSGAGISDLAIYRPGLLVATEYSGRCIGATDVPEPVPIGRYRLAPRHMEREEDGGQTERAVRATLIDAVRTTRKYGLGWMFISQTLSSLHTEIIQQLRIFFFGFGLGLGQEYMALRDLVGGSGPALDLYQLFRDPHSAFDVASRQYSFMTIGPVSPLSFSGTPLFFNAFNRVDDFLSANGRAEA